MDDLARQYWGRIKVARFVVMTRYFDVPSPAIRDRYNITYIPTVILFDKGVEVDRWRLVVMEDVYRYDLNKFLKARAAKNFEKATAPRRP
ncbi:MAG: thioredoxin family protein [Planctomycetes bacterium]|nr:thioredoxin family protein [Planctomycetota bacterium]